jgi:hypothetical protein
VTDKRERDENGTDSNVKRQSVSSEVRTTSAAVLSR